MMMHLLVEYCRLQWLILLELFRCLELKRKMRRQVGLFIGFLFWFLALIVFNF